MQSIDKLKTLIDGFEKNFAGRWVFGDKIMLGGIELIPVSEVTVELSGTDEEKELESNYNLRVFGEPVGYLYAQGEELKFVAISPDAVKEDCCHGHGHGDTSHNDQKAESCCHGHEAEGEGVRWDAERIIEGLAGRIQEAVGAMFGERGDYPGRGRREDGCQNRRERGRDDRGERD